MLVRRAGKQRTLGNRLGAVASAMTSGRGHTILRGTDTGCQSTRKVEHLPILRQRSAKLLEAHQQVEARRVFMLAYTANVRLRHNIRRYEITILRRHRVLRCRFEESLQEHTSIYRQGKEIGEAGHEDVDADYGQIVPT